ncbi:MarR family winged helix-turn-helix transcriptional regulator [Glutamicibacter arilaitensis]|uniref:MarR family winged helix-turn-helix transcriptional regulator n=1 Tax=Glutamicibacter arilaitensis TaxID=256701 RepID=UPI00384CA27B
MTEQVIWLSAEERKAWLGLNTLMSLLPAALDSDLQGLEGITLFDYHMLAMLSETPDRELTMTELAARTSASLSRLSHVVKKLEKRGWMIRAQSAGDARVKIASLTKEGWEAVVKMAPHHVNTVRALLLETLDDKDIKDLARISHKVVKVLDADHWVLEGSTSDLAP